MAPGSVEDAIAAPLEKLAVDGKDTTTELTADGAECGAKEYSTSCTCPVTKVEASLHTKHKGVSRDGCYQCVSHLIELEQGWRKFYQKYADTRTMVGLRNAFKRDRGSMPSDKTVMILFKCALAYPNLQVRAFVHGKYGGGVLKEVERAHYELVHE